MRTMWIVLACCWLKGILPAWAQSDDRSEADGGWPRELQLRQIEPQATDAVLFNPGMGLYLAGGSGLGYEPPPDAWIFNMANIVYFRPVWSDLEEEGPGSGFAEYFEPIFDFWVRQRGCRVAFRVMSESMHSSREYATPKWVFQQGVPRVRHVALRGHQQWDPVFWNKQYLDLHCQFIARLGQYLDGREGLEYVDIGGIGEWGEMHLGLHIDGRWTTEQMEETGFSRPKYIAAYRRVIDAHAAAFPNTRVFLNVGSYAHINDYAATRGMHFRQDGLTPRGPSADVGKRFYRPYAPRGVICNYEFHSSLHSMREKNWDLRTTVEQGLSDPISYLNTNVLAAARWKEAPEPVKEIFLDAARRVGFRFLLKELRVQRALRVRKDRPSRLIIKHQWENAGVAPCYESYALQWTLHDEQGEIVARHLFYPDVPTTRWDPGSAVPLQSVMSVPAGTPEGTYRLKVAMILPEASSPPIQLALAGADGNGRYELCQIPATHVQDGAADVYQEDFDSKSVDWRAREGIRLSLDQRQARQGRASLHLEGTQSSGWNYAATAGAIPVYPGSKYRLVCWMRVSRLEPRSEPPYVKLGVHDRDGQWRANITTNKYDVQRMGEWQRLSATAETPLNAARGQFAIERGTREQTTQAEIWIDDLSLELLEGP